LAPLQLRPHLACLALVAKHLRCLLPMPLLLLLQLLSWLLRPLLLPQLQLLLLLPWPQQPWQLHWLRRPRLLLLPRLQWQVSSVLLCSAACWERSAPKE